MHQDNIKNKSYAHLVYWRASETFIVRNYDIDYFLTFIENGKYYYSLNSLFYDYSTVFI